MTARQRCSSADDANTRRAPPRWLASHHDLDVLIEPIEESDQAIGGKANDLTTQQEGHLRLRETEKFCRGFLGQTASADQLHDLKDQLRLCQFFFWVVEAKVGEHIAIAYFEREHGWFLHKTPLRCA